MIDAFYLTRRLTLREHACVVLQRRSRDRPGRGIGRAERERRRTGVRVLVKGKQQELDPVARDEIYRIAREALRNAFRHAKAQKMEAEITYGDSDTYGTMESELPLGLPIRAPARGIGACLVCANAPRVLAGTWKFGVSMERKQKSS